MQWTYIVMPAFIMRYNQTTLELKRVDTDQWVDKSANAHLWKMIEEDGYSTSEKDALMIHEKFKQQSK